MGDREIRILLAAAAGVIVVVGLAGWGTVIARLRRDEEILVREPRRLVPWGLVDVAACFLLLFISQAAVMQAMGLDPSVDMEQLDPARQTEGLMTLAVSRLLGAVLALFALAVRSQATATDLGGVNRARLGRDIWLAIVVFAMVAPMLYGLQAVLAAFWRPTSHPVVTMLKANPTGALFGAAVATAVFAAPFSEEVLLRLAFQGWLEKVAVWNGGVGRLVLGDSPDQRSSKQLSNPPFWPIVISAGLFALLHVTEELSPDPIPLFFFALALGFVYQRTHRLLPCVLMHMLLNAVSLIQLAVSIYWPNALPFD